MARDESNTRVGYTGSTVVGLFPDQPSAEVAIQELTAAGFMEQQIGVAVRDREQQTAITEGTGTQAADGAKTGAVSGGVVGGVVGLLAGVGALVIPGIGPIIAGGALASTLAGAGIGAAAGGLLGALVGMGIPEEHAKHFERGFQEGGILLTVNAGDRFSEASDILADSGADLGPSEELDDEIEVEAEVDIDEIDEPSTRGPWDGTVSADGDRRIAGVGAYSGPERRLASQR